MLKYFWGIFLSFVILSCTPKVVKEITDTAIDDANQNFVLPSLEGPRTYVITDSVFFHMVDKGDPIETMKEFEVTIEKYNQDNWQACYNINPVYYVDCECNSSGADLDRVGSFCINYRLNGDSAFELTEFEGVIAYFNQVKENSDNNDLCPDQLKKINRFLERPDYLANKFKYHLLNIHRYEGQDIPLDVLSHRLNVYEDIDFHQPDLIMPGDSVSREVIGNSGGWEEKLAIYRTKSYTDEMVALQCIHGYKIWDNGMSWKEMGELFISDNLDFYSIDANNGSTQTHIRTKGESILLYYKDHNRGNNPEMTHIIINEYQLKGFNKTLRN